MSQQQFVRELTNIERRVDMLPRPELSPDLISPYLALPGLRGFWPMSSFNENGNAYDMSEQNRTLTYNGNPTYNYDNVVPYIDLDGTGDYLSRADEAGLDILGTETYVAAAVRGLSWGGWLYPEETGTLEHILTKWGAPGQRAYRISLEANNTFTANISDDGTNYDTATSAVVAMNTWYFVVGRFDPSTEIDIFVNEVEVVQATARASIFNSNTSFEIGSRAAGSGPFQGWASLCFLCATYLSDAIISSLFQQTRAAFRV